MLHLADKVILGIWAVPRTPVFWSFCTLTVWGSLLVSSYIPFLNWHHLSPLILLWYQWCQTQFNFGTSQLSKSNIAFRNIKMCIYLSINCFLLNSQIFWHSQSYSADVRLDTETTKCLSHHSLHCSWDLMERVTGLISRRDEKARLSTAW